MIEKARGQSCQATNFLKAFSSIPEGTLSNTDVTWFADSLIARRLSLTEDGSNQLQSTLASRIQIASRFLLEQIARDTRRVDEAACGRINQVFCFLILFAYVSLRFEKFFCMESTLRMQCMNCRQETFRPEMSRTIELQYKRWVSC